MDIVFTIIGLVLLLIVAFVVARFLLHLTTRVIGCILTAILALGIVAIVLIILL